MQRDVTELGRSNMLLEGSGNAGNPQVRVVQRQEGDLMVCWKSYQLIVLGDGNAVHMGKGLTEV